MNVGATYRSSWYRLLSPSRKFNQPQCVRIANRNRKLFFSKMTFNQLLSRAVLVRKVGSRSMFTSSKPDLSKPNWFRVGLAYGTSVFILGLLFKQHSTDIHEYKVRNGLE